MSTATKQIALPLWEPSTRHALDEICEDVRTAGGNALLVGGCVRDAALGKSAEDLDLEVYGIEPSQLIELLQSRFDIDLVGQSFGVIKLRDVPIDVSIPRRESKRGLGHKGFMIASDPAMDPQEAAGRRDFTINAISLDPRDGRVYDPFDGIADLNARVLRHTTEKFVEDPLRVLRGMQFVARFELEPAAETIELCRNIVPEGLAAERILGEWQKLIIQGSRPSLGLDFLKDCGWIRYFPELEALVGCEQNPIWHPEGDVWVHTLHCMDAFAAERIGDKCEDLIVGLAVLCHDLGKPSTTAKERDGRVTSKLHDIAGVELTRQFLHRMTSETDLVEAVVPLVASHLAPIQLYQARASDAAIRRLARRVERIDRLVRVARADQRGRPPLVVDSFEAGEWLLERARQMSLERQAPQPLVMGRHLIQLGLEPGPDFGSILEECFDRQIEGEFSTLSEGLECVRSILDRNARTENT